MPHLIREHNVPHALAQAAGLGGNSVFSLWEAGRRRGKRRQPSRGSPPAKALTGFGRALSRSRGAQVLLVSQSAPAQSLSSAVLDPPVQRACSNQAPIRELSLTATHSSPPAEGATPGSSSTCTNHNAFLLCVDLSGVAACVFRDFSVAFPKPHPT